MLSAEATRLAVIEVLCPTAALAGDIPYPTLAGAAVLDSRTVALQDLDPEKDYTPVIAVHTRSASIERRGQAADETDNECQTVIDIIAELAVIANTADDGDFADAMAADDPDARLVLSALVSQIRFQLEFAQSGTLFRRFIFGVRRIDMETFGAPELGLRWQRVTIRITAAIPDDQFDVHSGGLPEPLRGFFDLLPDDSYAKAKLTKLAAHFMPDPRPALQEVTIRDEPNGEPIASTGDLR